MNDDETTGDEEARELRARLAELSRQFHPSREDDDLTPAQEEIYETVGGVWTAMGRPPDADPQREDFPVRGSQPSFRESDPIVPRVASRGDVVTIRGADLYGIRDLRIGGRRARIVRRAFAEAEVLVPEDARDGSVRVNGVGLEELELDLVDDDSDDYGTVS